MMPVRLASDFRPKQAKPRPLPGACFSALRCAGALPRGRSVPLLSLVLPLAALACCAYPGPNPCPPHQGYQMRGTFHSLFANNTEPDRH